MPFGTRFFSRSFWSTFGVSLNFSSQLFPRSSQNGQENDKDKSATAGRVVVSPPNARQLLRSNSGAMISRFHCWMADCSVSAALQPVPRAPARLCAHRPSAAWLRQLWLFVFLLNVGLLHGTLLPPDKAFAACALPDT